ncbi:MAG: RNA polymerase sigma factor [Planctomycetes bacterium]|nr:RNA polymerase sigma factor [Planctomycetota bacterium]
MINTDKELLDRALNGDRAALAEVAQRFWKELDRYALTLKEYDRDAANDLMQDAFLKLCGPVPPCNHDNVLGWLKTILRNRHFDDHRRNESRPLHSPLNDNDHDRGTDFEPTTLDEAEDRVDAGALVEKLKNVEPVPGMVESFLAWCESGAEPDERPTYEELAQKAGLTEKAVRNRMSRFGKSDAFRTLDAQVTQHFEDKEHRRTVMKKGIGAILLALGVNHVAAADTLSPSIGASIFDAFSPRKVVAALEPLDFRYATAQRLRSDLKQMRIADGKRLLESIAEAMLDLFLENPMLVALAATLFDGIGQELVPNSETLDRFESRCRDAFMDDEVGLFASVEAFVCVLANFGRPKMQHKFMQRTLDAEPWREANAVLVRKYHGNALFQIKAFERHLREPKKKGLQKIHDTPPLVHLITSQDSQQGADVRVRQEAKRLLTKVATILKRESEHRMLANVRPFIENC